MSLSTLVVTSLLKESVLAGTPEPTTENVVLPITASPTFASGFGPGTVRENVRPYSNDLAESHTDKRYSRRENETYQAWQTRIADMRAANAARNRAKRQAKRQSDALAAYRALEASKDARAQMTVTDARKKARAEFHALFGASGANHAYDPIAENLRAHGVREYIADDTQRAQLAHLLQVTAGAKERSKLVSVGDIQWTEADTKTEYKPASNTTRTIQETLTETWDNIRAYGRPMNDRKQRSERQQRYRIQRAFEYGALLSGAMRTEDGREMTIGRSDKSRELRNDPFPAFAWRKCRTLNGRTLETVDTPCNYTPYAPAANASTADVKFRKLNGKVYMTWGKGDKRRIVEVVERLNARTLADDIRDTEVKAAKLRVNMLSDVPRVNGPMSQLSIGAPVDMRAQMPRFQVWYPGIR